MRRQVEGQQEKKSRSGTGKAGAHDEDDNDLIKNKKNGMFVNDAMWLFPNAKLHNANEP